MRAIFIPVIAAVSFAALPALAQSSNTSSNTTAGSQHSSMSADQIEQKLQANLSKAGYTDIKIVPGSFLVSAKDSDGQPTQMMISPHSVIEVTPVQSNASSGNSSGSGSTSNTTPSK